MTKEYETRIMSIIVVPEGEPTFSEFATEVRIVDEAAGEFVEVSQHGRTDHGKIAIGPSEWPALRAAIDKMIAECRSDCDE